MTSNRRSDKKFKTDVRPPQKVGIFNETDRLTWAGLWGPVGAEALLAQQYPPEVSLFFDSFDVLKARQEAMDFSKTLNKFGVATFFVRDELAKLLPDARITLDELLTKLKKRCPSPDLEKLIRQDVERYGLKKAVNLNYALSLKPKLPLGNLIYARDQMNVLLDEMIISSMAKPIRQPEAQLYKAVYKKLVDPKMIVLPKGETFEGGDAYIHNGFLYMGVGVRTTLGAAKFIFEKLEKKLQANKLEFAIVIDPNPSSRPRKLQMDFMHIDTFSNPIGDTEMAVCEEEAKYRRLKFLKRENGKTRVLDSGLSFMEHLKKTEKEVVVIPRKEQESFGVNFLAVDRNTLILPLRCNKDTNKRLEKAGKKLVFQDLFASTRGYGAAHCMTGQLQRLKSK